MSEILGLIRSHNGIVIVSDSDPDPAQSTAVLPINDHCVAVVFREKDAVNDFLEKYVRSKNPTNLQSVLSLVQTELESHNAEFAKTNFSFVVASYENETPIFFAAWFHNEKLAFLEVSQTSYFIDTIEDLAIYIITKVYSEQMTVEELKNLLVFVTLQCIKVFDMNSLFDITVISRDGVKTLSRGEVVDRLSSQDKKDNELKKIFSDFFIMEPLS